MQAVSFNLNNDVFNMLKQQETTSGISKNTLVNEAIKRYINDIIEDYEDARDCEEAIKDYIANGEEGLSTQEMFRGLE